ncbi:hypothetical protein N0V90_008272 [Kalmusia sp. IMI 367209]|nr:hypothetical protein N0V90_008272 [Kalmusia sp. IMI 367209]
MKFSLLSFVSCATTAFANYAETNGSSLLTVKTSTGIYTSLIDPKFPKTRQFRSVAFAEPPIQSRRWLPPQRLSPSSEHHYSHNLPSSCPQFISSIPSLLSEYFAEGALIYNGDQNHTSGLVGAATSEDCLYLAIWTPSNATSSSKLPVLVFLPGGGFQGGGINSGYYNPAHWIERSQSHIVVTVNYRLNIFGFPNARGLNDQNLGILDQRVALEWLRDNIKAFGGDADAIVQWGQSAGSMSSDVHAHAFYDDPIAPQHFGCAGTNGNDSVRELDCMRRVPFEQISNFVGQYGDNGATPALSFLPVVDDRIIFSNYTARASAGKVARLPIILSNTANEASSLVPFPADKPTAGFPQELILATELAGFICPTYSSTLERNAVSVPVYRYQYAGLYPNLNPLVWTGAYHGEDIPMVFGTYGLVKGVGDVPQLEVETSRVMQEHILAFVKDPYHGPQKLGWSAMDVAATNDEKLIRFGTGGKAVQYVDSIQVDGVCQGQGEYDAFP